MRELSLNILDIAQNSIAAGASLITIAVEEDSAADRLLIRIEDNGRGMTAEQVAQVSDPFYTTRTTRKVGMGIPLFRMAAEQAGGSLSIASRVGEGTCVAADFRLSSIDRMPLGDMAGTIAALIRLNPQLDFLYIRRRDDRQEELDTRQLRQVLDGVPLDTAEVMQWIEDALREIDEAVGGQA